MNGITEYIAAEWQRSPNPAWYKALGLLLFIGGMAWAVWVVIHSMLEIRRLRKKERMQQELMAEYNAMIRRHRDGAA